MNSGKEHGRLPKPETKTLQKGATADLRIENLAFGGKGIAREGGMVVFVEQALPGDLVRARITKRKPQYAEAQVISIIEPSPERVAARCAVFGTCGGCKWQNFNYAQQLRYKEQHVAEALRHIGKQQEFAIHPILASPDAWNYRNKMEYSFGQDSDGRIAIGLHHAGDFRRIVNVERCEIQPEPLHRVVELFRNALNGANAGWKPAPHFVPYDSYRHTGFLRHLVLRYSHTERTFLVAIITAPGKWPEIEEFSGALFAAFPECRGFTWGTNAGLSDVARIEQARFQGGDGYIEERLGEKTFRISTFSFFQTNTAAARILYDVVRDYAELSGHETVLDAYCGTGSIGIYVADRAKQIIGIELVKEAVWDARENAKRNRAENCTFLAGEMRDVLQMLPQTMNVKFDRVIVDPPRGGMDKKALRLLIGLRAPLLVYVSCNPATLSRDAVTLSEAGYRIEDVQPVDMFPHTYHVESVIKFRLGPSEGAGHSKSFAN